MVACECGQTRWRKCVAISLILIIALICVVVGVVFYISAQAEIGATREEVISELMSKHFESNGSGSGTERSIVEEKHPLDIWRAPEDMQKKFVYYWPGHDYNGIPVWIIPFGEWNIKDFLNENEENSKLLEMYVYQFSHRVEKSRRRDLLDGSGHFNTSFVLIADLDGYTYSQFASLTTATFLIKMATIFQKPLAEQEYGFVFNLDWVSRLLVNMIRPIISDALDKMNLLGTDKEEHTRLVLEKIPAGQLPPIYGGNANFKPIFASGKFKGQ